MQSLLYCYSRVYFYKKSHSPYRKPLTEGRSPLKTALRQFTGTALTGNPVTHPSPYVTDIYAGETRSSIMTDDPHRNAAIYIRVSTEDQAERGISLNAQEEFLKDWAFKENFVVFDSYVDGGYSGSTLERPALQRLVKEAKKGKFKIVLCYHNDRLSRDTKDALTITQELLKYDVRFRFSNLDVDLTTPEGELFFTLQAGFATYFRRDLSRKTKFGMQRLKKQGYWVGRVPDLYERDRQAHTRIIPGNIVERIMEMKKEGKTYIGLSRTLFQEKPGPQ